MSSTSASTFSPVEISTAVVFAAVIQMAFVLLLILAGAGNAKIVAKEPPPPKEIPIAVQPVMDDLPLLKLGGRKKVRAKLPDMWKKQPPIPIKRFEEKSAPSETAKDDPKEIPTSEVAKGDAEAPPPDAEIAKQVDETLDAGPQPDASVPEGEGSPDGVKEGTETDPLKARAVSLYKMKILGWFNARFRPPAGQIPCAELKKLSTGVSATVGPDRTVNGYSITRPSGNATFDAKVKATMDGIVGQQLPPPPPLYPDLAIGAAVYPTFSGAGAKCE